MPVAEQNVEETATDALCAVLRGEHINWPAVDDADYQAVFLDRARYHGVGPLVCHLLKSSAAWDDLPDKLKAGLQRMFLGSIAQEMLHSKDLVELLEALQLKGISPLLIKGCALAYTHYPEPSLRTRGDTDIFFDPADIRRLQGVLAAAGYKIGASIYKNHQFSCIKESGFNASSVYDIHWRSSNAPEFARVIGYTEASRESVSIPALNDCGALSSTHALMLACMHRMGSSRHDPDRLIWLYDIHLLVSGMSEAALRGFAEKAVEKGIQAVCLQGVEKAVACFSTQLPAAVIEVLSETTKRSAFRQWFAHSHLGLNIDDLRQLPDMQSRLALIRELFLPPADYLLGKYEKENKLWVPALYIRYFLQGVIQRIALTGGKAPDRSSHL